MVDLARWATGRHEERIGGDTMAMRKRNRRYVPLKFDELIDEPRRIEGFVAVVPKAKKFCDNLDKVIQANSGSSREHSRSCWLPLDEDYKVHRLMLSEALLANARAAVGGDSRPMSGKDIVLELLAVLPEKTGNTCYHPHQLAETLFDAMKYNLWSADDKHIGLIADKARYVCAIASKRATTGDDDPVGIYYRLYHLADATDEDNVSHIAPLFVPRDDVEAADGEAAVEARAGEAQVDGGTTGATTDDARVSLDLVGLGIDREMALRAACLADKRTPLHADVLRYYEFLLDRFDRRTARRLALYEQTRLDSAYLLEGEAAAEAVLADLRGRTDRLADSEAVRTLSLDEIDG